jgi:SAM-dependent methyltransferase
MKSNQALSNADVLAGFKAAQKRGWSLFAPLESTTTAPAARVVSYAGVRAEHRVLDVGCGTGVVAVTAARAGAHVTGLDLTRELLERAADNATIAGVEVEWREADVERMPLDDAEFDVVLSQFGHMFAPRADVATAEMLRVLKPGGTLAFATWPPRGFTGRLLALIGRYAPPPPIGVSPPPLWGEPDVIRERLADRVANVTFEWAVERVPALSPQHFRVIAERAAGPLANLVRTLSSQNPDTLAAFRREFDALTSDYFTDNVVRQDYLLTRATKK